ncbi:MAG: type II/IV secretion system protein [Proteobacteria bacterium]|nr:type II/IV secretion system protein [Pseudomonadota bacterium]
MQKQDITSSGNEKLTLDYVLKQLLQDDLIIEQQITQFRSSHKPDDSDQTHPLVTISNEGWNSHGERSHPLTLERLTKWLAEKTRIPYVRIDPLKIDVNKVTSLVSQAYAANLKILPLEINTKELTVASCEPFFDSWVSELSRIVNLRIKRVLVNPNDIERYLVEFYGISRSILGAVIDSGESRSKLQNFEQLIEVGKMGEPDANDQHIVSIVDWLLQFAFEQRASDIHLEPRREKGKVRFRIDGVLHLVHEFPIILMGAISSRLKSLGRMDVTDRRRPQDGRIKTKTPTGDEVEMRLSTMPTAFGEKLVIRIFNPEMLYKSFADLGFSQHDVKCWKSMAQHPHGIILVTGPTGSGKTTTLYSALKQLARPEYNICTIEDPIEMVDDQFNQMQVQRKIGVDFATGVRTLLRQDPDIIMIGEIRDFETADVAIQAALTGHLVLSSLHTNDAPSAITRLIDIGVQPFLINASLLGILAQRLVRTLCSHCKKSTTLDKAAWSKLIAPSKLKVPNRCFKAAGCDECKHTGYLGRIGIYEILPMNTELQKMVADYKELNTLRAVALKQGMRSLRISGAQKIAEGLTTLEEIFSVIPDDLDKF